MVRSSDRIRRIAKGSGTEEKDVRSLLNDFNKMKKFYKMFKNDRNVKKNMTKFFSKK